VPATIGKAAPEAAEEERPPAELEAAAEALQKQTRERSAKKAAGGRGRRASVPSWDEIMFGNSRQPD
jgi:hypothetical protein